MQNFEHRLAELLAPGKPGRKLAATGVVFPPGAIRENAIPMKAAGIKASIQPVGNCGDADEIPEHTRKCLNVVAKV